jgi:hypothetical protein
MKNLAIIISVILLASCNKEDASPSYDNKPLANTYWYAKSHGHSITFTATECTENYMGFAPITKPYFLKGNKIHFYSLNNSAYTEIKIQNGNTMYWNYQKSGSYSYLFYKN